MFSELVDRVIARTGRPDRKLDIINWANITMRECQSKQLFFKDLIEDSIDMTNASDPYIWTYPINLRVLRAVMYPDGTWPNFLKPGKAQNQQDAYFYAASTYMVFVGVGTGGQNEFLPPGTPPYMKLAYYIYLPYLSYYAVGSRPAVLTPPDPITGVWTYNPPTSDPVQQAADQALVTNWLLLNWSALIEEGTVAKVFKDVKDSERATLSYSLYKSLQGDLVTNEASEGLPSGSIDSL